MFFTFHFKKRFTERSLDLIWQIIPDFGTFVVEELHMNQPLVKSEH